MIFVTKKLHWGYISSLFFIMFLFLCCDALHIIAYGFGEEAVNGVFALRSLLALITLFVYVVFLFTGVIPFCRKNNIRTNNITRIYSEHCGKIKKTELLLSYIPAVVSVISALYRIFLYNSDEDIVFIVIFASFLSLICQHGVLVYIWLKRIM